MARAQQMHSTAEIHLRLAGAHSPIAFRFICVCEHGGIGAAKEQTKSGDEHETNENVK